MLAYLQQKSLSVAAVWIMPALHFDNEQIGTLMLAFTVAYGALQLPGGVLGQFIAHAGWSSRSAS